MITSKSINIINNYIQNKFNYEIIMISGYILISKKYDNFLDKYINGQTTSGYLVNCIYY
jgi:hypothetical protein